MAGSIEGLPSNAASQRLHPNASRPTKRLHAAEARELVEPTRVAASGLGARLLLTIKVADVDAVCAELARHGVKTLNGPVDRPWGRRTAAFADPAGNLWEVAQEIRKG